MRNNLGVLEEYLTGAPMPTIVKSIIENFRNSSIFKSLNKEKLESLCFQFSEIDFIAMRKVKEDVLKKIDIERLDVFLGEENVISDLENFYGTYFSRCLILEEETHADYVFHVCDEIAHNIIAEKIKKSIRNDYDADDALYFRAREYAKLGYISMNILNQISRKLGKEMDA